VSFSSPMYLPLYFDVLVLHVQREALARQCGIGTIVDLVAVRHLVGRFCIWQLVTNGVPLGLLTYQLTGLRFTCIPSPAGPPCPIPLSVCYLFYFLVSPMCLCEVLRYISLLYEGCRSVHPSFTDIVSSSSGPSSCVLLES